MGKREERRRAIRQHHLLHESLDVDFVVGKVAHIALARIAQAPRRVPCPRQSIIATAKPRSRKSRTVSKYFSMYSLRPVKTQTVPLRLAGGAHREKRNSAPSGVLIVPDTTSSGTGLAGIETSVMEANRLGRKRRKSRVRAREKAAPDADLNAFGSLPYHLRAGHDQRFRTEPGARLQGCTTTGPARWRAGSLQTVAQWRTNHASLTSPRFIVPPSALTASSRCSTRLPPTAALATRPTISSAPARTPIDQRGGFRLRARRAFYLAKENTLTIKGEKVANENDKEKSEVLYRGIARARSSAHSSSPISWS